VIAVSYVHHFAENRYGFHFKDTDEFGLYGSFYDDSRDKTYPLVYPQQRGGERSSWPARWSRSTMAAVMG
jgi:hypothetical protein